MTTARVPGGSRLGRHHQSGTQRASHLQPEQHAGRQPAGVGPPRRCACSVRLLALTWGRISGQRARGSNASACSAAVHLLAWPEGARTCAGTSTIADLLQAWDPEQRHARADGGAFVHTDRDNTTGWALNVKRACATPASSLWRTSASGTDIALNLSRVAATSSGATPGALERQQLVLRP